jgi:hypothetical protein
MVNGLMFEKGSLATPSGGGLSLYSFLVYFAPDLYTPRAASTTLNRSACSRYGV